MLRLLRCTRNAAATAWLIGFMFSWALHWATVTWAKRAIADTLSCIAHVVATKDQDSTQPEADVARFCCGERQRQRCALAVSFLCRRSLPQMHQNA